MDGGMGGWCMDGSQEDGWRRGMGDWWMDQRKHNSMQILGKLCFRKQGLELTGVTFPATKQPPRGI